MKTFEDKLRDRVTQLEGVLKEVLDCLDAKNQLFGVDPYRGMGVNIVQEKAARLSNAAQWARRVLENQDWRS